MHEINLVYAFIAALAAGFTNAIAGGGTLITFPVLVAIGIPPIAANITNTIALCPGYFGGVYAQRKDFYSQKKTLLKILPVSIIGGIAGGLLLLQTSENSFKTLIPYLILLATLLLAVQTQLKKIIKKRSEKSTYKTKNNTALFVLVFLAAIYGGYFGAGLGVILMAVLGLVLDDSLTQLNALKQAISLSVNVSAAIYFAFSDQVYWLFVAVMVIGSIIGGLIGGKVAGSVKSEILRWTIVIIGLVVAVIYFVK
jgi:hypothetical protein